MVIQVSLITLAFGMIGDSQEATVLLTAIHGVYGK